MGRSVPWGVIFLHLKAMFCCLPHFLNSFYHCLYRSLPFSSNDTDYSGVTGKQAEDLDYSGHFWKDRTGTTGRDGKINVMTLRLGSGDRRENWRGSNFPVSSRKGSWDAKTNTELPVLDRGDYGSFIDWIFLFFKKRFLTPWSMWKCWMYDTSVIFY